MKITTQQFATSFHALNGITIGERRKNLFLLLNNTHRNEHHDVDFSALQPNTHLETIFKVEVLLYFQKNYELIDVLKSENPILIEKVLKAKSWFWNEAFANITGQQFVDDILGCISYNTKVQVLNKLAIYLNNPVKGNEYYESVKSKYGLYLAGKLIPCCTKEFILSSIKCDHIKLMETKLLFTIKRYPDIIEDILPILHEIGVAVSCEYDNVFKYIAHTNMEIYLKLRKTYKTSLRLGWRCTQKYVNSNKQDAVTNAKDYYEFFHQRQMVRSLKTQFNLFYANMFPKTVDDFGRHDMEWLLKIVNHLHHPDFNIILKTFNNLYGKELWSFPEFVTLQFLEMLPAADRENKLQRDYKPQFVSDDKWMCYYPIKVSIPYLKERISLSSDYSARSDLVGLLVLTCKINKDKAALAQICQFIINRHRNDNVNVRLTFLRSIQSSFKLEELDESHWTPINDLIKIFTLNDESFYNAGDFLENYILYRLKQNLPIREYLVEFCKLKSNSWNLFTKFPTFEKLCLTEFGSIIPELYTDEDLIVNHTGFIGAIINYNQRHSNDKISIFSYPLYIESVKKTLQKKRLAHNATSIVSYCMHLKDNVEECKQLFDFFLTSTKRSDLDILIYLIHKNPEIVQKHYEKITSLILQQFTRSNYLSFWKYSKNYEHLQIPQNIIKLCLIRIKEDTGDVGRVYDKKLAIDALSYLMPAHEYLQIVALHYPRELKADAQTKEGQKTYELQEYIANSLKYLTPPSEALESILMFCKGDYLKLIQSSLYSVCCNTNEDKLQPFFAELIGRAVSIRKHALHLTFHILDKSEIFSVLDKFMKTERNASIRKFIFKHTFNFFVKNRDEYSWELVKMNIIAVDVNDQEAFDILMQHNKIPKDFLDKYLTFTWEFLEKLPDPENKIVEKKTILLNSIREDIIPVLGKQFSEPILEKYFFKFTKLEQLSQFQSSIQSLACKYIIYGDPAYVSALFTILKNYINTSWFNRETEASGRYHIQEFIEKLCSEFMGNEAALSHGDVLNNFANLWNDFLKPHDAFLEYLHLKLSTLYLQKLPINGIVTQLATLTDYLVNLYGLSVIGLIANKIDSFLHEFIGSYDEVVIYDLILNLATNHSSLPCMLIAIKLMDCNCVTSKTKQKYEEIIKLLRDKNEPIIKIFLHVHFTKPN